MAVGTWGALSFRHGAIDHIPSGPIGVVKTFTASSSDGSVPAAEVVPDVSGLLVGVDVALDANTTPDSVIVSLLTIDDIVLPGFPATALTASGRIEVSPPVPVCGGFKITITDNTTNSGVGTVTALMASL